MGRPPRCAAWVAFVVAVLGVHAGCCIAAGRAVAQAASGQAWPSKPLRWIVPYTPGGLTDAVTRLVITRLSEHIGQPIVIENRPGANSITGMEALAAAAPDGATFGTVIAAHAANATLYAGKLPFDAEKSFAAVSLVGIAPLMMTTRLELPVTDAKSLIELARAQPGKLAFGSSGIGSAAHLTSELLKQTGGLDMLHVPYKGTAPAMQGLLGGEIQVLVDVPLSLMPQVRAGKIRGIAVFAANRAAGAPELPTIVEAGGPPIEAATWVMLLAPARTPADIVARLSGEVAKLVAAPEMAKRLGEQGVEPVGADPKRSAEFLAAEIAKWGKVITTANVKPE